jgi:hypothetical protein
MHTFAPYAVLELSLSLYDQYSRAVFGHSFCESCATQPTTNGDNIVGSARHEISLFGFDAVLWPFE